MGWQEKKARSEVKSLSRDQLCATPWTVAYKAPLSMEFSGQEYWSGLPFPSPGDLPNPGVEPGSPTLQPDTLPPEPPGAQIPNMASHAWIPFPRKCHPVPLFTDENTDEGRVALDLARSPQLRVKLSITARVS